VEKGRRKKMSKALAPPFSKVDKGRRKKN